MFTANIAPSGAQQETTAQWAARTQGAGHSTLATNGGSNAADIELTTLATQLAANSNLSVDDFKRFGLARLKELVGNALKTAPVMTANDQSAGAGWGHYDINNPDVVTDGYRAVMAVNAQAATDAKRQELAEYNRRCAESMKQRYDINDL